MTALFTNALRSGVPALAAPPLLAIAFSGAEASQAFYESGGLWALAAAFFVVLVWSLRQLSIILQRRGLLVTIVVVIAVASGPFWGLPMGVQLNAHGFAAFLFAAYILTVAAFAVFVLGRTIRLTRAPPISTGC